MTTLPELRTGTPEITNVLKMMVQDKMHRSMPQNVLAQKELDYINANPNYLTERYAQERNARKLKNEASVLDWAVKYLNFISPERYPQFREAAIQRELNPDLLPESFQTDDEFEQFKQQVNMGYPEYKKLLENGKANFHVVDANGVERDLGMMSQADVQALVKSGQVSPDSIQLGKAESAKSDGGTSWEKELNAYMAMQPDDPRRAFYENKLANKGMVIESDGKGGFTIKTNADQSGNAISGAAQSEVEKKLLDATYGLARLNGITSSFKPQYQELGTRLGTFWTSTKEKLGIKPSAKEVAELRDFSAYKRRAISNLNLYIKEITGAQMSEKEAERLTRGMPNPGQGLLDGDSPSEFRAKLEDVIAELRMAAARYHYIKKNGIALSDIPLSKMPDLMNRRAQELESSIKAQTPGLEEAQVVYQVRGLLAQEFGLIQ